MSSITEQEQKIKTLLLPHLDELSHLLASAVEDGVSAHEVEQGLWKQMLSFGHQPLGVFFTQCGVGDGSRSPTRLLIKREN